VGLWTRLAGFGPEHLEDLMTERAVLRAHLMRNTVHLVSAQDYLSFRPLFQLRLERTLAGQALTRVELGRALAGHWPGHDPGPLAYAASHVLALVQVPPRGLWGTGGPAAFMLASAWLDGPDRRPQHPPLEPDRAVEQLVLRYLAAYGPATVADIQAWSGLTRLREVTGRLAGRLRTLAGPDGAALLDLPGASRPAADVPAPPVFLPEYNLLLSFADRGRVIPHRRPVPLPPGNGASAGTLLVDGEWQGDWKITRVQDRSVLEIRPYIRLRAADADTIAAEGGRLLQFTTDASAAYDVRFTPPVRVN
jgi:hypothetical protein